VAEIQVTGESQTQNSTTLRATVNGKYKEVTVRVPDLSLAAVFMLMACLALFVLLRKQNTSK
jgi:hypothetical protein